MESQTLTKQIKCLYKKPGHEKVKHILCNILKEQLGATDQEIDFERRLTCQGRIDALWGRTIFEIKRSLEKELTSAKSQIKRYIQSTEKETGKKYVGIATDGQKYIAYFLLQDNLKKINEFVLSKDNPLQFIQWLESVILIKDQLEATPKTVCKEIGQGSPLCENALIQIKSLWIQAKNKPDIRLKYKLWKKSVDIVYGTEETDESLFIEHTYLTIISKAIAHVAFFDSSSFSGKHFLNGKQFKEVNVFGVVEDDFFSWITFCETGNKLIREIASHVQRFDFSTIQADILKDLYEGLIRQEQRHKMGEYYTPDWLAEKICKEVIKNPLQKRVIDPACGSGTFLFHSIRLLIFKAEKENMPAKKTISLICEKIAGIDIHPVAVIFSRITYLLAMLNIIKKNRPNDINIPVYLGDSLQWSVDEEIFGRDLRIDVPEDKITGSKRKQLVFPGSMCQDSSKFDTILRQMIHLASKKKESHVFNSWIENQDANKSEKKKISRTYKTLLELQKENRNHIWGYVARNLTRPIWLSSEKQKADVVIGNPPWLKFNSMNEEMQTKLKEECFSIKLWEQNKGQSKFRTSQDISTYFFVRSVDLYMKEKGEVAFVMPFGVINGPQHSTFRKGIFERESGRAIHIKFKNAWIFDSSVKNLFKIPSCVLFSIRKRGETSIPKTNILYFNGNLPEKNTDLKTANKALTREQKPWPQVDIHTGFSYYHDKFKQGASLVPRRFLFVEKIQRGNLGGSSKTPLIRGIKSNLDKPPWKNIKPLENKIESQFLMPVYTGGSIAPFRKLKENLAIIPWSNRSGVMNSSEAEQEGWTNLHNYLEKVEKIWNENGTRKMNFKENINYRNKLNNQFYVSKKLRVVYTASGTHVAAVLLEDEKGIIDTSLYYTQDSDKTEGFYLEGILNSDSLIEKIKNLQSQGQWGTRHFHRHLLKPYFPKYSPKEQLHKDIVSHTKKIKLIAENVDLDSCWGFIKSRQQIKKEIKNKGKIWEELNNMIIDLLNNNSRRKVS